MMKILASSLIALSISFATVTADAQDVANAKQARSAIVGKFFTEFSNSLQRDIVSEFTTDGQWIQREVSGKHLWTGRYRISNRGEFCRPGQWCRAVVLQGRNFRLKFKNGSLSKEFRRKN